MEIPNHIALIPDGNRRWSQKKDLPPWKGHWKGAETIENFLNWCLELDIPQVSVWIGSIENLTKRSKRERLELYKIYRHFLNRRQEKAPLLEKYQVKVRFLGDIKRLPSNLVKSMERIMRNTESHQKKLLNVLINYGGKFELLEAFKKIALKFDGTQNEITEKDVEDNLLVQTPVDMIVRTGGFNRLSNFMLWQGAYSEIYVTKTLLPDFSKKEFMKAIRWYSSIKRNFGA